LTTTAAVENTTGSPVNRTADRMNTMEHQSPMTNTETTTTDTTVTTQSGIKPTDTGCNKISVTIETFNCHGFKESSDYILSRISNTDFMCLSETWIKPSEHNLIQKTVDDHIVSKSNQYIVFNKSGMVDEDEHAPGRPYGGVAIICRVIDGLSYELISCINHRIIGVLVKDLCGNPLHVVISTYMPYFDKSKLCQTEAYIECIDALQSLIDDHADVAPIKILGDLNVQLPRSCSNLSVNWHKANGFNSHSCILHDFIVGNGLKVVDQMFKQSVNYTYFNIPRGIQTWIDHIISTEYDVSNIYSCDIIPLDGNNVSDHLPLRLRMYINIPDTYPSPQCNNHGKPLITNWSRNRSNIDYTKELSKLLNTVSLLHIDPGADPFTKSTQVDHYMTTIHNAMMEAARKSGIIPRKLNRPKNYWCPDLSRARDTKRFWWCLWTDNGRPRSGEIFKCYKHVKNCIESYHGNAFTIEIISFISHWIYCYYGTLINFGNQLGSRGSAAVIHLSTLTNSLTTTRRSCKTRKIYLLNIPL
jgi:hypothetical protein